MGWLDPLRNLFTLPPEQVQVRTEPAPGSLVDFVNRMGYSISLWTPPSIREALGVPAVFGILSSIANTVGALSLEAWRNGSKVAPEDRPRLIVRPDPFRRPGSFFRDTAWNLGSRGEAWWWVAKRDIDGSAMSVINVPPNEVMVTDNPSDLRFPIIEWRGRRMPNEDMRQITYIREPGELRGRGPLQMCSAAVSVAKESQDWAANFYAEGGIPGTLIKHAGMLSGELLDETGNPDPDGKSEADWLREQWVSKPNNVPRVIDQNIESVTREEPNTQGAQMLDARQFQVGELARAFSYPMSLIGHGVQGSSITYQNVGQELDKLVRTCLWPFYLEKMEQELTDLLPRTWTTRFNVDALNRADEHGRWGVYETMTKVLGPTEAAEIARRSEGIIAGDVETAPIPFAPPAAIPTILPIQGRSEAEVRCDGMATKRRHGVSRVERCNRLLSTSGAFIGHCPRCKKQYAAA